MKRKFSLVSIVTLWLMLSLFAWVKPSESVSDSERRNLAQFPKITVDSILSGDFMEDFSSYAVDQFPLRDRWRTWNAYLTRYGMGQTDINGIYLHEGYAVKMEYPLNTDSTSYAAARFDDLYRMYLEDSDCCIIFTAVPDKNFYSAEDAGMLMLDYNELFGYLEDTLDWATFVDITDELFLESYYRTDTHWRQEALVPVAEALSQALDISVPGADSLKLLQATDDFLGVYYGQLALPMESESIEYYTWDGWEECEVYSYDTDTTSTLYDTGKLSSKDPYEFFLSGNMALQTIENPNAATDRELVIFRDSFGSSIAPLFAQSYTRVTLIDTRYIQPSVIGQFVEFTDQDVLFLYSTLVLNSSSALRK